MKAMKQIVVAVSLVVISAMAPVVEAQQGVEKAAPGTLVAPADALNSLVKMTERQMISLVKALPADKYGFAPSAAIFAPGQQTEYAGFEKVEVETSDGRIQSKSTDPGSIHFREGLSTQSTEANTVKADLPKIDESLHGTEYVNRTGKFSLTLPPEWIINADLRQRPVTLAGLSSSDKTRFAIVEQKEYPGSLASYKELTMAAARITLSNFEELSQSSATIDGKRAILVLYRGNIPVPPNTSVELVTAFISRSDNNFTKVTAWCAESLFHDMQPAFEKLVTSYHSSPRPAVAGDR